MNEQAINRSIKEDEIDDLEDWYLNSNTDNPERSKNSIIMVCSNPTDLNNNCFKWDTELGKNRLNENYSNRYNRVIGFLILHGTSHNAGFVHNPLLPRHLTGDYGYASPAYEITQMINSWQPKLNFEDIIKWTIDDFPDIIKKTNERFGF